MVATKAPRVTVTPSASEDFPVRRLNSPPTARSTKQIAVSGAMRPGCEVPTAPGGSVNSH